MHIPMLANVRLHPATRTRHNASRKPALTCGSGPRGIRSPDLMAASHKALNGVLDKELA
jgi:hypothetical protein